MLRLLLAAFCLSVTATTLAADPVKIEPRVGLSGQTRFGRVGEHVEGYTCGSVVFDEHDQPRACFGVLKPLEGAARYKYFLVLRTGGQKPQGTGAGSSFESDGDYLHLSIDLDVGAGELELFEKIRQTDGEPDPEKGLRLGDRDVGRDDPRVFLVDLRAKKVEYVPVDVALPTSVPDFSDDEMKTWPAAVFKAIDQLKATSPKVREFLEGP